MHLTNLHTHTTYCDGQNSAEEMIQAAIKCGFQSIGISTHGPVSFENSWSIKNEDIERYINEINRLKKKYKDHICVFLGMELDYIPGIGFDEINKKLINRLDYYIGSVHCMGKLKGDSMWTVDGSFEELIEGIDKSFNGSMESTVEAYYTLIAEMAINYEPPIIGHLDLIKKYNKNNVLFDENESWYKTCVINCLESIKKTGSILEVNTGGMSRGYINEQYPSDFILELIKEMNIPIMINSDSHDIGSIDYKFDEMYELIRSLRFDKVSYLTKSGFSTQSI